MTHRPNPWPLLLCALLAPCVGHASVDAFQNAGGQGLRSDYDLSGGDAGVLKASHTKCVIWEDQGTPSGGEDQRPSVDMQECTFTVYATSNWPTTSPIASDNNNAVQQIRLSWGDGDYNILHRGSDIYTIAGVPLFAASHEYLRAGEYEIVASFTTADGTHHSSALNVVVASIHQPPSNLSKQALVGQAHWKPRAATGSRLVSTVAPEIHSSDVALLPAAKPAVDAINISFAESEVPLGQEPLLSWHSSGMQSCTMAASLNDINNVSGPAPIRGTANLVFETVGTYRYTLTCRTEKGETLSDSTEIRVTAANRDDLRPRPGVTILAVPEGQSASDPNLTTTIYPEQFFTLQWDAANVTHCVGDMHSTAEPMTVEGQSFEVADDWTGNQDIKGSLTLTPYWVGTYTYTLTCTGDGAEVQARAVVTVEPHEPELALSAVPDDMTIGLDPLTTTLSWSVAWVNQCTASGDWQGFKNTGFEADSLTHQNTTFSTRIDYPEQAGTYSYTLTCIGQGGTVQRTVSVNVRLPPPPDTRIGYSVSSSMVRYGNAVLSWESSSVVPWTCTATGAINGVVSPTGSQVRSRPNGPIGTEFVTLSCTNIGGTSTRTASLQWVSPPPPSVSAFFSPSTAYGGDLVNASLYWSSSYADSCLVDGLMDSYAGARGLRFAVEYDPDDPNKGIGASSSYTHSVECYGYSGVGVGSATVTVVKNR
ncbi:hypothetical protein [Sinimarinibacterium sp. NLF-5-8]|uniref:hypothetical protein n=1 Tax=Sinimarinibacterium sp. NLF-5-8 TaxID=2698684 RepID=UPI00137BB086|nr:hypothetical protein [Sinimarinibacterium sp. NLF-5-8]QHS08991.1 hypothetical protein GT972_01770 [Sinimarinibacterium sp. NLF-5-8]